MTDWYATLQSAIDFYFINLQSLTMLEYFAVVLLLIKKLIPGGKKGGFI